MVLKKKNVRGPEKFRNVVTRRIRKIGAALYIPFPKPIAEEMKIKVGDLIVFMKGKELKISKVEED